LLEKKTKKKKKMSSQLIRKKTKKQMKVAIANDDSDSDPDATDTGGGTASGSANTPEAMPRTKSSKKARAFIPAVSTPLAAAWGRKTRLDIACVFEQGVRDAMEDTGVVLVANAKRVTGPSVVTVSPHVRLVNTVTKSSKRILAIFGVFDGHGGPETSARLRRRLADAVLAAIEAMKLSDFRDPERVNRVIEATFVEFDREYCDEVMNVPTPPMQTSGSTALLVIVLAKSLELIVCNVGDCRAVLCRGRKSVALSRDHLPNLSDEKRRILATKTGFLRDDLVGGVLQMTRAFGDYELKDIVTPTDSPVIAVPEITRVQLDETDSYLLVACDGLWDVYSNRDVVKVIDSAIEGGTTWCEGICNELVRQALARGSTDNTSAILCHITRNDIEAGDDFDEDDLGNDDHDDDGDNGDDGDGDGNGDGR
jgi:serine/threonine protein phosphatase PrpC